MPQLDRIVNFDERSRQYGVRSQYTATVQRRKRVWTVREQPLNQGREGACVGFGWSNELAATPVMWPVVNEFAFNLYRLARAQDAAMGNHWPQGASVLAGAKACAQQGWISGYRWAFSVDDVIDTLVRKGPLVLGINWYSSMFQTQGARDGSHLVEVSGNVAGGHCILANGYIPDYTELGEVFVLTNSWGTSWGDSRGSALLRRADLERLLAEDGEACTATDVPSKGLIGARF